MSERKFKIAMSHNVRVSDDDENTLHIVWEYSTCVSKTLDVKSELLEKAIKEIVETEKIKGF